MGVVESGTKILVVEILGTARKEVYDSVLLDLQS